AVAAGRGLRSGAAACGSNARGAPTSYGAWGRGPLAVSKEGGRSRRRRPGDMEARGPRPRAAASYQRRSKRSRFLEGKPRSGKNGRFVFRAYDHHIRRPPRKQAHADNAWNLVDLALHHQRVRDHQPMDVEDPVAIVGGHALAPD